MVQAYVIDTSVLIQAYIQDTYTPHVLRLMQPLFMETELLELHTPEFALLECANALWKQTRFHGLDAQEAQIQLQKMRATPLYYHSAFHHLPAAFEIGHRHHLAAYDSVYLALATSLSLPLLSIDRRQLEVASNLGVQVASIDLF